MAGHSKAYNNCILFCLLCVQVFSQDSHNVQLLGKWKNPSLSSNSDGSTYNDVTGFEWNGEKYAAICSVSGTHFIQINGSQLTEVDSVNGKYSSSAVVNRDVFFYDHYIYAICDHGFSSLQIIDISYLPDSVHKVYDSDSLVLKAHSIFIDSSAAKMYICGPENLAGNRALDIFSLSDPVNPQFLSSFNLVSYVHDIYVRNDTAYMNCAYEGMWIADFSNATLPVVLGSLVSYPDWGYNHSGWPSEDGKWYVFTDETAGRKIKLCNLADLSDMEVSSLFNSGGDNATIAHNPVLRGDYVYVSHYYDGLQVFSIKNKQLPLRVAWYDTHTQDNNPLSGAWGIYLYADGTILVSDMQEGLFYFRFLEPPSINTSLEHGVYPNPVSEEAYFYYQSGREFAYEFYVFDITGKKIVSENNMIDNYYLIDTRSWAGGVYIYHLQGKDNDTDVWGKFVVYKP